MNKSSASLIAGIFGIIFGLSVKGLSLGRLSLCSLFHPDLRLHQIKKKISALFEVGTREVPSN
jgi:hypothetical protein